jgi:hypothetical protein
MHAHLRSKALLFQTALLSLAAACSSTRGPLPLDPAAALEATERNLTSAHSVRSYSRLTAEGLMQAELRCEHQLDREGRALVRVVGTFGGQPIDALFTSDGKVMRLTGAGESRDGETPEDLWGGMLIGMTRMGLMHNVALIASGGVPEGTDGNVRNWLRVLDVAGGDDIELNGVRTRALTFGLEVDGKLSASVVLWVGIDSGLPLERWQRVFFPAGEMRVTEVYEHIVIDGPTELEPDE